MLIMVDVVVKGILNLSIILNTTARDSSVHEIACLILTQNPQL